MIFKVAYCKWCGNENLRSVSSEQVYCHNCGEYSIKDKLGYRDSKYWEEVIYKDYKK